MIKSLTLALLVVGSACTASGQSNEKTQTYLNQFRADFTRALLDEKPEIVQSYFADDIRLMPEFQKTILNRNNTLTYWKAFTSRFDTQSYTRTSTEMLDMGSRILEIGTFSATMKLKSDGKPLALKGKYLDVWEKKGDRLLLLTQAWNYDHAVPFGDQLKFADVPSVTIAFEPHVPVDNPVRFDLAALNHLMEAVITQGDAKIWSQFYTDDAAWMYTGNSIVQGRTILNEFFDKHTKELPIFEKLDIRNDRIDDTGKYVIEYASHTAIVRNGDFSGVFTGKDLVIWRRESNGSLRIFRHIAMYD